MNGGPGGTGAVTFGANVVVGSGGTINVSTATGGNNSGGSVTQTAGTLNAGSFFLSTPTTGSSSVGTSAAPIALVSSGGQISPQAGNGGAFVTNTGDLTLQAVALGAGASLHVISTGTLTLPNSSITLSGAGDFHLESQGGTLTTKSDLTTASGSIFLAASSSLTINTGFGLFSTSGDITVLSATQIIGKEAISTGGDVLIATAGNYSPTTSGTDITANLTSFLNGCDLLINIVGPAVDSQYTQLKVAGAVDLTGLNLQLTGGYVPLVGDVFTVVSATSITGQFSNMPSGALVTFNGKTLQVSYTATSVQLANPNPGPSNLTLFIGANFDENESTGIIGSFTNPDGEAHTVTIDFGDGSTPLVLNLLPGESGFQANHVYLDDNPSGTQADNKTVTVTVSDGISSVTGTRNTLIHNVAPSNVSVNATPTTAGSASSITINFTDPGTLDPHLIDIDFGDGSPVQSSGVAPGLGSLTVNHVYANQGTFTITATVHDDDLGTAAPSQTTVNVGNPDTTPPTIFSTTISKIQFNKADAGNALLVITVNFDEAMDTSINPILTFSPSVATSFTLTSSQWTNSTRHVFTYSFADANLEIVTFGTVAGAKDLAGNQMAPDGLSVGIKIDTVLPLTTSIDDGDADNLVIINTPLTHTITFSENISGGLSANDLDNAGTASISIGTITNVGAGVFTVVVTPTSAGTLRLRIPNGATVTDLTGNPLTTPVSDDDTLTVILAVPVVTPAGNQSGSEGASKLFNLGSFTDPNNSGNYTVTVNWGDGTPNTVFNQAAAGTITAQNHTYAQDGNFPVTITVSDVDGSSSPVGFLANNANVLPVAVDAPDQNGVATIAKSFALGSFTDPGADAPWHITVQWGDGSPNGSFTVNAPGELPPLTHTFANAGQFNVVVTVQDDDGSATSDYLVNVIPPIAHVTGNVFRDFNNNGQVNAVDVGLAGVTIFADRDGDGELDANEPFTTTDVDGNYQLDVGFEGAISVRQVVSAGFKQTTASPADVNVQFGDTVSVDSLGDNRIITPTIAVAGRLKALPFVQVRNADGTLRFTISPFTKPSTLQTVRLATGDVNDDGIEDIFVVPGPGASSLVKMFDGADGHLISSFTAFATTFTGGASIAAGDVNGDGVADIVVGTDKGAGPLVKIFDGSNNQLLRSFVPNNASSYTGVKVALGDVDGDGVVDVITSPGTSTESVQYRVRAQDALTGASRLNFLLKPVNHGVATLNVTAGDLDHDGRAEIILATSRIGQTRVQTFKNGVVTETGLPFAANLQSTAFSVAAKDLTGDGIADLLFAGSQGQSPRLKLVDSATGQALFSALLLGDKDRNGLIVG
ncbi:MAG: PKD domain-containing protein [Gemmatales bacterium]